MTMPPLAVPSSLVSASPVTPTAAENCCACASAFWPWLASSTSSTSCGALGSTRWMTRRTFFSSSIRCAWLCRRPAVSAMTTSLPRIEHHRTRIRPGHLRDEAGGGALGPHLQLLDSRGAEGVPRGQQHAPALLLAAPRQLADGGGLARTVDPDHQDHERALLGIDRQRARDGPQDLHDARAQGADQRGD